MWTLGLLIGAAQGKEYVLDPAASGLSLDDVVRIVPEWLDVTPPDYVIRVAIHNDGAVPIVIRSEGLRCIRGSFEGKATYGASFGIGERSIDLMPGEIKTVKLLCDHGTGATGDFGLKIARIDVDRSVDADGEPIEDVDQGPVETLFTNISWNLKEADVEKKRQKSGTRLATGSYDRPSPEAEPEAMPEAPPPPPPAAVITTPG